MQHLENPILTIKIFKWLKNKILKFHLNLWQIILISFLGVILTGTLFLLLPVSHNGPLSFMDALFTSTSAVCVTGLNVKDTPNDFTLWGQIIILLLIHVGGLGYMTYVTFFTYLLGFSPGLEAQKSVSQMFGYTALSDLKIFIKRIFILSLMIEATGTIILFCRFIFDMPFWQAVFFALFHSISAFNNAGFSLFSANLINYVNDPIISFIIPLLIVVGGIGFIVIDELIEYFKHKKNYLSTHFKIAFVTTAILIIGGFLFILLFEYSNELTLGKLPLHGKIFSAWFQSITPRTAGFNTISMADLYSPTRYLIIFLMFVGGSPGGTAGGIKTVTFAIITLTLLASLFNKEKVIVFNRYISSKIIFKSFLLSTITLLWIGLITLIIANIELSYNLGDILFEVVSAYGTVGLSVGDGKYCSLSALFTDISKFNIVLTMFVGRIGVYTLILSLLLSKPQHLKYPEAKVLIG